MVYCKLGSIKTFKLIKSIYENKEKNLVHQMFTLWSLYINLGQKVKNFKIFSNILWWFRNRAIYQYFYKGIPISMTFSYRPIFNIHFLNNFGEFFESWCGRFNLFVLVLILLHIFLLTTLRFYKFSVVLWSFLT